ncbi:protein crumbs isoform X2 [Topomyia yanbarensis]|uniref:protein crumbs isoform X2 n=1 Tax=Topomyia yanbarensis TaxID=2498891 RepID=UPI00273B9456|nr:protein crumbs isoform X2 [Topomyia yanbarensis]
MRFNSLFAPTIGVLVLVLCSSRTASIQVEKEAYFNGSSYLRLKTPMTLWSHSAISFKTCRGGEILSQRYASHALLVSVLPDSISIVLSAPNNQPLEARVPGRYLDNKWHTLQFVYQLGTLYCIVDKQSTTIANQTLNSQLITNKYIKDEAAVLILGNHYSGCLLHGPGLVFNQSAMNNEGVVFGPCPLAPGPCTDHDVLAGIPKDHCSTDPCMQHGTCISRSEGYECHCTSRFKGKNCEIDMGNPCQSHPCQHGSTCQEDVKGDYKCICVPGYTGVLCETELSAHPLCESSPCLNEGICRVPPGKNTYECDCLKGYIGSRCEINWDDCKPNLCLNGGKCVDGVDAFTCDCKGTGYGGTLCQNNIDECSVNPCLNGGTCFDTYGSYLCECPTGFTGTNCHLSINECKSQPCQHGGTCIDTQEGFDCRCLPGYSGELCEVAPGCSQCPIDSDCIGGQCVCKPGTTGLIGQCAEQHTSAGTASLVIAQKSAQSNACSSYCYNGASCALASNSATISTGTHNHPAPRYGRNFTCICASGFTGSRCESPIALPYSDKDKECNCLNGGSCPPNSSTCTCPQGYEGQRCESLDVCTAANCPEPFRCIGGKCQCPENMNCDHVCASSPCLHNGSCFTQGQDYLCQCTPGYEGKRCENDVDECKIKDKICVNGICQNTPGSFRCFCTPGYTGLNCDLDVDECLSHPCKNNAQCLNRENDYECICPPGYSGKECSTDIDECESNPCSKGSTCIDRVANFTCMCIPGMTGRLCEIDIDDCESQPCLNGGRCIDQLGGFLCDCNQTGYSGSFCQLNIDECESNPCTNGAECMDKVNDYICKCYPGYSGKNCEEDIDECESNPCQYSGKCLQRSNITLYYSNNKNLPAIFTQQFSFQNASGYECICVPGTMGKNCEVNINECDSSPCKNGNCVDGIGNYTCECEPGFEGIHCETDIDECLKYQPCVHGTCMDGRNNYNCDCDGLWGGKNCSVRLTGCVNEPCLNGGACIPYLENETQHKFNCSCRQGFQGKTCDTVTTMSLAASSLLIVNTSRDEGYDIQLRFKTTLPNGILAFGNGATSYILVLNNGRLNLHSALLNRWEGVFIGSGLNDSKWQKVFVAINSSHLVLSANEEQTIYPINSYEGTNGSNTSFPITYLGGTTPTLAQPYLKHIARAVSSFVGCMEDVVINGQWVLPGQEQEFTTLHNIDTGCPRTPQCEPNPCNSNGHCTDLWHTFSCSCQRPHLGHTCKYNITAATFGHENTTRSAVKVIVSESARRAIRSVLDISMFIRTRQGSGMVFYLGSDPDMDNNQNPADDSYVAAFLSKGELLVRMIFNDTPEGYTVGGNKLDNGYLHLIEVIRNSTLVQVKLNGTEYFRKTLSSSGQLNAQVLYLGGPPPYADSINSLYKDELERQYFKGIIQDVQVSNGSHAMIVELYPLNEESLIIPPPFGKVTIDRSSVLEGVVTDDLCRNQPCKHDAICANTWNDFVCTCPRGYKGKLCQEIQFCELQKCPQNATCQNLDTGYECISNMTFHDDNEPLKFSFNPGTTDLLHNPKDNSNMDTIEISYRTKFGGTLLYVQDSDMYFEISTIRKLVTISWRLSMDLPEQNRFEYEDDDNYGWHTVFIMVTSNGKLEAGWKGWETTLDPQPSISVNIDYLAFKHLFSGRHFIYVGGMPANAGIENNSVVNGGIDKGSTFKGCLGETRVGGYLLPYFPHDVIYPDTFQFTGPHFNLNSSQPEEGCMLCFQQSCKNGGICSNPSEKYACDCPAGYESDDCSQNIDECLTANCTNNSTCIDGVASFTCRCLEGYEGDLCEFEIDECMSNPCHNGGTCTDLVAGYQCQCTEEYAGLQCDTFRLVTCENQPCRNGSVCIDGFNSTTGNNFTCSCKTGFAGPLCDTPFCLLEECRNDAVCIANDENVPICRCTPGYTGRFCEIEIDECESAPCLNGGQCIDFINIYRCNCSGTGFEGLNCEADIDECYEERIKCGGRGLCINTRGSFRCQCDEGMCGKDCAQIDPCRENPNTCENGGICIEDCDKDYRYYCNCTTGFTGINCSEQAVLEAEGTTGADIALIVVPVVIGILALAGALIGTLLVMARNKRATRGTYSPSAQEYCNPRLEMDNMLKIPPEERLI